MNEDKTFEDIRDEADDSLTQVIEAADNGMDSVRDSIDNLTAITNYIERLVVTSSGTRIIRQYLEDIASAAEKAWDALEELHTLAIEASDSVINTEEYDDEDD